MHEKNSHTMMALAAALCLVLALAVGSVSATESETLINRRVLEEEPGYDDLVKHLTSYEIHDFSKHEPTRRALSDAGEGAMSFELNVLGRRRLFDLERNDDLFSKDYKHYYLDGEGKVVKTENALDCIYKGRSRDDSRTLIAISLCDGTVRASVHGENDDESFTVQPLQDKPHAEHVVYRHRDLHEVTRYCGVGRDLENAQMATTEEAPALNAIGRRLREQDVDGVGHHEVLTSSSNTRSGRNLAIPTKTVGVVVVNDKKRFEQKGNQVHLASSALFATVNNLFTKIVEGAPLNALFNIRLEIVSQYTFTQTDPWTFSSTASPTSVRIDSNGETNSLDHLDAFDFWRQANAQPSSHDLGHLLTGYTFQQSTIGVAYVSAVCRSFRSGITQATDLSEAHIASTITHEIGHNLGSKHTDVPPDGFSSCLNANGGHIMAASSSGANTNWEPCSVHYFNFFFQSAEYLGCADTSSAAIWNTSSLCGDGIVQGDEECDCINRDCSAIDPCCDGATCRLLPNRECSALDGCCNAGASSCTIITDTNHVCRPAVSDCDIQETCNGVSGVCPSDVFEETGTACALPEFGVTGTCFFKQCMDQTKDCVEEGRLRINPSEQWNQTCCDETGTQDYCGGAINFPNRDCTITCKLADGCQRLLSTFYSDGTQCATGKGCFQGSCIPFAEIPLPINSNCTNGVVDQNETDLDCGGPNCFGCGAGKLCVTNNDCAFPGFCNKTELSNANGYVNLGKCESGLPPASESPTLSPVALSCLNTVKDNDETDVDCGGAVCPKCSNEDACIENTDCTSGICLEDVCSTSAPSKAPTSSPVIVIDYAGSVVVEMGSQDLTLFFNVEDQSLIRFQVVHTARSWVGFGVSSSGLMIGGVAIIGMSLSSNPGQTESVGVYDLNGQTVGQVVRRNQPLSAFGISHAQFVQTPTSSKLEFTLNQSHPNALQFVPSTATSGASTRGGRRLATETYIFAHGGNAQVFDVHAARVASSLDLAAGTEDGGAGGVPLTLIILSAHVACGLLSFAVLMPIGASIALTHDRLKANSTWFKWHRRFQILAVVFALCTLGLGVYYTEMRFSSHFRVNHQIIGVIAVSLAVFQAINGLLRAHKTEGHDSTKRIWWERLHRLCAALTLLLGLSNIILGPAAMVGGQFIIFDISTTDRAFQIISYVFAASALVLLFVAFIVRLYRGREAAQSDMVLGSIK